VDFHLGRPETLCRCGLSWHEILIPLENSSMDGMYSLYAKLLATENKNLLQVRHDVHLLMELLDDNRAELPHYYDGAAFDQHCIIMRIFESRAQSLLNEVNQLANWLDVELQKVMSQAELQKFAQRLFNQLRSLVKRWEKGEEKIADADSNND
jgi:hypothetical protein